MVIAKRYGASFGAMKLFHNCVNGHTTQWILLNLLNYIERNAWYVSCISIKLLNKKKQSYSRLIFSKGLWFPDPWLSPWTIFKHVLCAWKEYTVPNVESKALYIWQKNLLFNFVAQKLFLIVILIMFSLFNLSVADWNMLKSPTIY